MRKPTVSRDELHVIRRELERRKTPGQRPVEQRHEAKALLVELNAILAKKADPKSKILFLGNGVNNFSSMYSWGDLVSDLIDFIRCNGITRRDSKPFPMLYEEILQGYFENRHGNEIDVKEFISKKVGLIGPNELHSVFRTNEWSDIITTNYDHAIEKSISPGDYSGNSGVVKETEYNLFRHNIAGTTRVWHIHGDMTHPRSITLGFEHYSGLLQNMRLYVTTKNAYAQVSFASIEYRLETNSIDFSSWIDLFFTRNIYIVGFRCSFVEMDVWWLLTFRAQLQRTTGLKMKNSIFYFLSKRHTEVFRAEMDLFESYGVRVIEIDSSGPDDLSYYEKVIRNIDQLP